jgi:hypothetical protein
MEPGDAGPTSDATSLPDVVATVDATPDAPVRSVACGPETCLLPDEVCCVYYGGTSAPIRFCASMSCPVKAPNDGGYTNKTQVSCDDSTDCETPGNVCCAASTASCSASALTVVECRAPENCAPCGVDAAAGVGYHFCRPTVTSDCPPSAGCSGTLSADRFGDYRYCK